MLEDFRYAVETEFAEHREAAMIGIEQDAALADLVEHIVHHDPPDAAVPKWLGDDEHAKRRAIPPVQPPHRGTDDLAAHFRDGSRAQRQGARNILLAVRPLLTHRQGMDRGHVRCGHRTKLQPAVRHCRHRILLCVDAVASRSLCFTGEWQAFAAAHGAASSSIRRIRGVIRNIMPELWRIMLPGQSRPDRHKRPILRHTVRFFKGEQACGACDQADSRQTIVP
jgi:hypothetical protein